MALSRAYARGKPETDEIVYDAWQALPEVPAMQPVRLTLMDIDGDGRLDWVVARPGDEGDASLSRRIGSGRTSCPSTHFCLAEFFHPRVQLADLVGAGLSDPRTDRPEERAAVRQQAQ